MGLFERFPYTNFHELNAGWMLEVMKKLEEAWEQFTAGNSLSFANPLTYDATKSYAKNTIVLDSNGNAYISLQAVPKGVAPGNQDYWLMAFDYEAFMEKVNKNFTGKYYRDDNRAKTPMAIGDWLTLDDVLYKVIAAIAVDDLLEEGTNIEAFTLEDFIKAFIQSANQTIQQYKNDIDASELLYRQQLAQDIANITSTLQAQLDAAISGATVDSEVINARVTWNGITYPTLRDAIVAQMAQALKSQELTVNSGNVATYPTIGNYPNNSIILINGNAISGLTDSPYTSGSFIVMTFAWASTGTPPFGGQAQLTIPLTANANMKYRAHNGVSWSAWSDATDLSTLNTSLNALEAQAVKSSNLSINSGNVSSYPTIGNYPNNSIAFINQNAISGLTDSPYTTGFFEVMTFAWASTGTPPFGGQMQLALPLNNDAIKYRYHDGANWSAWREIVDITTLSNRAVQSSELLVNTGNVSSYNNIDTYPLNKIVLIAEAAAPSVSNAPYDDCTQTVISSAWASTGTPPFGGEFQIVIPDNHNNNYPIVFRYHDGNNWTPWSSTTDSILYADPSNFIEVIESAVALGNCKVYLESGTYYLFDATHDEAYWIAKRPATRYCGIILGNNVEIIGAGNVILDANYTGSDSDILENFSIFNIIGNCKISNLTLDAENICYLIHDDQGIISTAESTAEFESCIMVHHGSSHVFQYGAPICIGGGTSATNVFRKIHDCLFSSTRSNAVNYHTATGGDGKIELKDNWFEDGTFRGNIYYGGSYTLLATNNRVVGALDIASGIIHVDWNNDIN